MNDVPSFAERLAEYIDDMGLENKQLAAIIGKSAQNITAYLKGPGVKGGGAPTLEALPRVADTLGVSLDWLLGRSVATRWSPEIQNLRLWLRAKAPVIAAADVQQRIIRVIQLAQEENETCRQDWFMAGVCGLSLGDFAQMMSQAADPTNVTLSRLAEFTSLPEMWYLEGGREYLQDAVDLAEYTNAVLKIRQLGITPEELDQNVPRLADVVTTMRRLVR